MQVFANPPALLNSLSGAFQVTTKNNDMANEKQQQKLTEIKDKSLLFAEGIKNDIYSLLAVLDYKNSSRLSYNVDRINLFIEELTSFEIIEN